jgi:uncharacterized protein
MRSPKKRDTAVRIAVRVTPRASRDEIDGWHDGRLGVRLKAVAERGRANVALEALLARELGIAKGLVRVVAGHAARYKLVAVAELGRPELERRLERLSRNEP